MSNWHIFTSNQHYAKIHLLNPLVLLAKGKALMKGICRELCFLHKENLLNETKIHFHK